MGVGLGAGVGKAKNELVSDTNSFFARGQGMAAADTAAILAQGTRRA